MSATEPASRVVVVEDDEYVRKLLVRAIGRWFVTALVSSFESGELAWAAIQLAPPQVLLTDYLLLGMTGLELARRTRACSATTTIVLVSALNLDLQERAAVDYFLAKPLNMSDLRFVLAKVLA